jgi:hypothetical protein
MYKEILDKCSKEELLEIDYTLNTWGWDDRLGEKPDGWDEMPRWKDKKYKLPTKSKIIRKIMNYISTKVSYKAMVEYNCINHCNMTQDEFDAWWKDINKK